jgi:ankyrin repeat protein
MRSIIPQITIWALLTIVSSGNASELFTDLNLLPSEERAFKASMDKQLKASKQSIKMLNEMKLMMTVQSLSTGQCEGIVNFDKDAKAGNPPAQFILGLAYFNGWCVKKNISKALSWWRTSADKGDENAQFQYGLALHNGTDAVPANPRGAVKYLKMAALGGNNQAQYLLGEMYLKGDGVPKDVKLAKRFLIQSATAGYERAIFEVGVYYMRGLDGTPNIKKAMSWFKFGAVRGSAMNQAVTASFLSESESRSDLIEAYKWANVGGSSGANEKVVEMAVKTRDRLEKMLTQTEIQEAQAASGKFKPNTEFPPPSKPMAPTAMVYEEVEDPTATPEQKSARALLKKQSIPLNRLEFFKAIQKDDLHKVKLFIRAGASLESIAIGSGDGPMGVTPIYVAVDWGALSVYRYLMNNNVNINVRASESGYTALVRALSHERYDIARELLERGADARKPKKRRDIINSSALGFAVGSSHPDIVKAILRQGGSLSERYGNGMTPLQSAVNFGGSIEVIKVLLDAGSDPNEGGKLSGNPLQNCFDIGKKKIRFDALNILLEAGADPNLTFYEKRTPMFSAVWLGSSEAIQVLAKYGSDLNRRYNFGNNEIPVGIQNKIIRDVLKNGGTPLMMAAAMGHIAASDMLLKLGADPDVTIKGEMGKHTVTSLAQKAGITIPGL